MTLAFVWLVNFFPGREMDKPAMRPTRILLSTALLYGDLAEISSWPIFTQVPEKQMDFFRDVGFREVASITLDLNYYVDAGSSDMGTQEWVQMLYSPRSARSMSPSDRGERR